MKIDRHESYVSLNLDFLVLMIKVSPFFLFLYTCVFCVCQCSGSHFKVPGAESACSRTPNRAGPADRSYRPHTLQLVRAAG